MRFKHKEYQNCLYKTADKKLQFKDGEAETDDPELINALKANPSIEVLGEPDPPELEIEDDPETTENNMTATELRDLAREKGIKGYSNMTKEQLIAALKVE